MRGKQRFSRSRRSHGYGTLPRARDPRYPPGSPLPKAVSWKGDRFEILVPEHPAPDKASVTTGPVSQRTIVSGTFLQCLPQSQHLFPRQRTRYETRQTRVPACLHERLPGNTPSFPPRPSRADTSTEIRHPRDDTARPAARCDQPCAGLSRLSLPPELKEAACEAVNADINQYAITWGAKDLREALAERVKKFNGMTSIPKRRSRSPAARPRR